MNYRSDIDALRGLAVSLVVIFHAFPSLLSGGFIGVDIFFVISGFLITTIIYHEYSAGNFSLLDFYSRRIKRLFPALLIVLSAILIFGYLILFQDEYKQLGFHAYRSSIYLQNFTLIKELGYFDISSIFKPLLHLWSLSIEEQFYLLWPFLLLALLSARVNIIAILAGLIIFSFGLNLYLVKNYKDVVFFHLLTRSWEISLGALLGILLLQNSSFLRRIKLLNSPKLFYLGLSFIIISAIFLSKKSAYPYWYGSFQPWVQY